MGHIFKKKHLFRLFVLLVLVFIVGGTGGLFFEHYVLPRLRTNTALTKSGLFKKMSENVTVINKTEQITVNEDDSVNKIASRATNSVVNIISSRKVAKSTTQRILGDLSQDESMSGTGIIVTSDGMVVTYRGAIIEADAAYTVLLANGTHYEGMLAGMDEFSNLAYIKIDASNLSTISFADSNGAYPGKKLVAIGNSFGEYQNRFAAGLLSNINKVFNLDGKTVSSSEKLEGVFETDFNDQKEYLGGPVINYAGELVGIVGSVQMDNQQKYFQIPSDVIKESMDLAIKGELQNRSELGLYYVPITKEYSLAHGLNRDRGALVYSPSGKQGLAILADSVAEKAGVKINDIIIAVDGKEINLDNPLSNAMSEYKKGDKAELLIIRDEEEIKIIIEL